MHPIPGARSLLPSFQLSTADGRAVGTWGYKGRWNLVLYFIDNLSCPRCAVELRSLAEAYEKLRDQQAEVLVIAPSSLDQTGGPVAGLDLPFPVLVDADLIVHGRYGALEYSGSPVAAVFVADRYGEIFAASVSGPGHQLLTVDEILSWLRLIEIQCPECGAPEWPPS